ncbi:MAG TPA: nitroreductase family deazaflavin-dependent oxidoreductase [Actinomycetota bacterium]|nr:nitroreductase family deazaflavin-dependent oxidoreductase [Actinomycetota bacterium]
MRTVTAAHVAMYRGSRGKLGSRMGRMPVLLLTTTGRKSGKPRTTPLSYVEDRGSFVLAASNGGNPWFPSWYHNLKARPAATVQTGAQRMQVAARVATAAERERLWPKFVEGFKGYESYAAKTSRPIPLVILTPEL